VQEAVRVDEGLRGCACRAETVHEGRTQCVNGRDGAWEAERMHEGLRECVKGGEKARGSYEGARGALREVVRAA
jgi:hypothetical protein